MICRQETTGAGKGRNAVLLFLVRGASAIASGLYRARLVCASLLGLKFFCLVAGLFGGIAISIRGGWPLE